MHKKSLLICNTQEVKIQEPSSAREYLIPLYEFDPQQDQLTVKVGDLLHTGDPIFTGVYSPVTGTIEEIEPTAIAETTVTVLRISKTEKETISTEILKQDNFLEKEPRELLDKLNRANLNFCQDLQTNEALIISAIDSDPLATVSQQLLRENQKLLAEGITLMKHLTSASKIFLALPAGFPDLDPEISKQISGIFPVKPVYPNNLPELIVRNLKEKHGLTNPLFLSVEKLLASVTALTKGDPFITKVVSITDKNGTKNYRVRLGTQLKDILQQEVNDGEKIIVGSPMSGYTCYHTKIPITEHTHSIYIQNKDEVFYYPNHPCMNCGKCVRVCPVHLDVNLICRLAEFSLFDNCLEYEIQACIECGLCAFCCPSGRSLLQLIRLAKKEINSKEGEKE